MRECNLPNDYQVGSASSINLLGGGNLPRIGDTSSLITVDSDAENLGKRNEALSNRNVENNYRDNLSCHFIEMDNESVDNGIPVVSMSGGNTRIDRNYVSGKNRFRSRLIATSSKVDSSNDMRCPPNSSIDNYGYEGGGYQKTANQNKNAQPTTSSDDRMGYFLWIVTPVAASLSVAIVLAAVAGPHWLFTEEKQPNANYNGTANFKMRDDGAFISKYTKSSLWILCSTIHGVKTYSCMKIDYFPTEEYRADPHDSTLAIPYTIIKSAPYFFVAAIALVISFIVFLIAICSQKNNLYYFAAGILFIVTGLLMFIGLIVYVSIFKAEIGPKLRPKSTLQPPLFTFNYGQSFFLYVLGFFSTEVVGVLNIFLFISLQQSGRDKIMTCFSFINTSERVRDIQNNYLNSLKMYEEDLSNFMCKKHSIPPNVLLPQDIDKRYCFEKANKCCAHPKSLAKSLNELYTDAETEPKSYGTGTTKPTAKKAPLMRSVSTSTDIFSSDTENSFTEKYRNNFDVNWRKNRSNSTLEILNSRRDFMVKNKESGDDLFNEICLRTGVRPKPQEIYIIDDRNDREDDDVVFIVDEFDNVNKIRRNSLREPSKRNSNISLQSLDKIYLKNLFNGDHYDSGPPDPELWCKKNQAYNMNAYASKTLPRNFMKRNSDNSRYTRPSIRLPPEPAYLNPNHDIINPPETFRKSYDNVFFPNVVPPHQKLNNNLTIKWPTAIPTSPSSYSTKSYFPQPSPNREPSSYIEKEKYAENNLRSEHKRTHHQFDGFDLDQIERERRKSHANLFEFGMEYDLVNGTPV